MLGVHFWSACLHALLPTAFELTRLPVAANLLVYITTHSITHLLAISAFLVISFIPDVFCLQKYKGIWICLELLKRGLAGNYVNFGVFELYGDPALKVTLLLISIRHPSITG